MRNRTPKEKPNGPPENGIVKILRRAVPFLATLDYLVIFIIVARLVLTLFRPTEGHALEQQFDWLFLMFPTGGVVITSAIAAGLITARLGSLESDRANIAAIKDEKAKKERYGILQAQIDICKNQRIQAILFGVAYIVLVGIPSVTTPDFKDLGWKVFLLGLIVGEMLVPLLNMRTFSIVEESMHQIDVVRNVIYHSNDAAMQMLTGIGTRAHNGELSKQDLRALRRGNKGDVEGMLTTREGGQNQRLDTEKYVSLREAVTHVRDGMPITTEQNARYKSALAIARRIRDHGDEETKRHFAHGAHNQLQVSQTMAGKITAMLANVRTRAPKVTKISKPEDESLATEATEITADDAA